MGADPESSAEAAGRAKAAGAARRKARTRMLARAGLLASLVLLGVTVFLGYRRWHVPEAQRELLLYFKTTFPGLHAQTRSVQGAMLGLVDEHAPPAATAVALLDENVIPSIDLILEQARSIELESLEARALHAAYIQAIEAMRADAATMRATFADETLPLAERRRRVNNLLAGIIARFDGFYDHAVEVWRQNGIQAAPRKP